MILEDVFDIFLNLYFNRKSRKINMNTADLFLWILDNLNYWVVLLFMAIESSFIPFPSEVVVPPAAWKAMDPSSGMNFVLVVVFATLGADLGALINYYLAKWVEQQPRMGKE